MVTGGAAVGGASVGRTVVGGASAAVRQEVKESSSRGTTQIQGRGHVASDD